MLTKKETKWVSKELRPTKYEYDIQIQADMAIQQQIQFQAPDINAPDVMRARSTAVPNANVCKNASPCPYAARSNDNDIIQ